MQTFFVHPFGDAVKIRGERRLSASGQDEALHAHFHQAGGILAEALEAHSSCAGVKLPSPVCAVGAAVIAKVVQEYICRNRLMLSHNAVEVSEHLIPGDVLHRSSPFGISGSGFWGRSSPSLSDGGCAGGSLPFFRSPHKTA